MKKYNIIFFMIAAAIMIIGCSENVDQKKSVQDHEVKSSLVRSGEIDLQAIDLNNDDSLYECPMDWNVLADQAGDCPVCGMKLKEYTLVAVKQNLAKYGYEYKK